MTYQTGEVCRQAEYVLEEAYASYPEKHSVWDKLSVPTGTMTLEA